MTIGAARTAALEELSLVGERFQAGRPGTARPRPRGIRGRRSCPSSPRPSSRGAETAYEEAARFGREPPARPSRCSDWRRGKGEEHDHDDRPQGWTTQSCARDGRRCSPPAWRSRSPSATSNERRAGRARGLERRQRATAERHFFERPTAGRGRNGTACGRRCQTHRGPAWRGMNVLARARGPVRGRRGRMFSWSAAWSARGGRRRRRRWSCEAAQDAFRNLGALRGHRRGRGADGRAASNRHGLTKREIEVLRLVASGKSRRQVADQVIISQRTITRHVRGHSSPSCASPRAPRRASSRQSTASSEGVMT